MKNYVHINSMNSNCGEKMVSEKYDIKIEQGETFKLGFRYKDSSNNNALASAISANAMCRIDENSKEPLMVFDCEFSSNNETLWITLDANTSIPHANKSGLWDVKVNWPDKSLFLVHGKFRVLPRATR